MTLNQETLPTPEKRPTDDLNDSDSNDKPDLETNDLSQHETLHSSNAEQPLSRTAEEPVPQELPAGEKSCEAVDVWVVLACACIGCLLAGMELAAFSVYYTDLVERYDASYAAVGWCVGIQSLTSAFACSYRSYFDV